MQLNILNWRSYARVIHGILLAEIETDLSHSNRNMSISDGLIPVLYYSSFPILLCCKHGFCHEQTSILYKFTGHEPLLSNKKKDLVLNVTNHCSSHLNHKKAIFDKLHLFKISPQCVFSYYHCLLLSRRP